MAKTLSDCVTALNTIVDAVTGISDPGTTAPDSINSFPFVVTFPGEGEWIKEAGWYKGLHTLRCEIHVPLRNFPTNRNEIIGYGETIKAAIYADLTLTGTCDTINRLSYTFGPLGYGTLETYGYAFEVEVKIQNS